MIIIISYLFTDAFWKYKYLEDGETKEVLFDNIDDAVSFSKSAGVNLNPKCCLNT